MKLGHTEEGMREDEVSDTYTDIRSSQQVSFYWLGKFIFPNIG